MIHLATSFPVDAIRETRRESSGPALVWLPGLPVLTYWNRHAAVTADLPCVGGSTDPFVERIREGPCLIDPR